MPKDLEIKDVADVLSEADLQNPHLPFLSFDPDHIHLLMFQLAGPVIAEPDRVGPKDEGRTTLEMIRTYLKFV